MLVLAASCAAWPEESGRIEFSEMAPGPTTDHRHYSKVELETDNCLFLDCWKVHRRSTKVTKAGSFEESKRVHRYSRFRLQQPKDNTGAFCLAGYLTNSSWPCIDV
jgi:hypothetical protein